MQRISLVLSNRGGPLNVQLFVSLHSVFHILLAATHFACTISLLVAATSKKQKVDKNGKKGTEQSFILMKGDTVMWRLLILSTGLRGCFYQLCRLDTDRTVRADFHSCCYLKTRHIFLYNYSQKRCCLILQICMPCIQINLATRLISNIHTLALNSSGISN